MSGPYLRLISSNGLIGVSATGSSPTFAVGVSFTSVDGSSYAGASQSGVAGRGSGVVSWIDFIPSTVGRAWDGSLDPPDPREA
jgi:hypothetical protein